MDTPIEVLSLKPLSVINERVSSAIETEICNGTGSTTSSSGMTISSEIVSSSLLHAVKKRPVDKTKNVVTYNIFIFVIFYTLKLQNQFSIKIKRRMIIQHREPNLDCVSNSHRFAYEFHIYHNQNIQPMRYHRHWSY